MYFLLEGAFQEFLFEQAKLDILQDVLPDSLLPDSPLLGSRLPDLLRISMVMVEDWTQGKICMYQPGETTPW